MILIMLRKKKKIKNVGMKCIGLVTRFMIVFDGLWILIYSDLFGSENSYTESQVSLEVAAVAIL